MERKSAQLTFDAVDAGYHGRALLKEISFAVGEGEICTLIGPNGTGKSTLLKTVLRMLKPMKGEVSLNGRPVGAYAHGEISKITAAVLTRRSYLELMSCRDVVEAGRYPYTGRLGVLREEDRRKASEILELMHATALAERNFNSCSDGEKQRVLIGRALCQEPSLLILDEPTSYLDIRYKLDLMEILRKKAREEGVSVLMSLHEIELALRFSDHIICIRDGGIFFRGTPKEFAKGSWLRELYEISEEECREMYGDLLKRIAST